MTVYPFSQLVFFFSASTCLDVDCSEEGKPETGDEEGVVTASTGIFVLDPNDATGKYLISTRK